MQMNLYSNTYIHERSPFYGSYEVPKNLYVFAFQNLKNATFLPDQSKAA